MAEKKTWKNYEGIKNTTVRARMDAVTVKQLDECCEMLKTTRSDIMRSGIKKIHEELFKNERAANE